MKYVHLLHATCFFFNLLFSKVTVLYICTQEGYKNEPGLMQLISLKGK